MNKDKGLIKELGIPKVLIIRFALFGLGIGRVGVGIGVRFLVGQDLV